jgi:hypothetical protein
VVTLVDVPEPRPGVPLAVGVPNPAPSTVEDPAVEEPAVGASSAGESAAGASAGTSSVTGDGGVAEAAQGCPSVAGGGCDRDVGRSSAGCMGTRSFCHLGMRATEVAPPA